MNTVYFVVSPPRTGTKSLCRMAHECGYKIKHAPVTTVQNRLVDGHNFFADTPCFAPSFVKKMCDREDINVKFIYIEKDYDEIFNSWKKVNLYSNYTRMYNQYMDENSRKNMKVVTLTDFLSLHETFSEVYMDENNYKKLFDDHKEKVLSIIKQKNKEVLMYKFTDGWESFCKFLDCEVPNSEVPHLNINTMFEKII
jgi:hypothetical protein